MQIARSVAALALLGLASSAAAHDTWLLPRKAAAGARPSVTLDLTSGMAFPRLESAIAPDRLRRAGLRVAGREMALSSRRGTKALVLVASGVAEGVAVAWVELHPRPLELTPAQVEEYLAEIGEQDGAGREWARRPEPKTWRETYRKLAKAVFVLGPSTAADDSWREPAGLALEIVPEASPARVAPGGELPVRVLKEGRPLPGFALGAVRAAGKRTLKRTDAEGRVSFVLDRPGPWMLAGVELRSGPDGTWESDFTTLTLTIGGGASLP